MKNLIEKIKELTVDLEMVKELLQDTDIDWIFDIANDIKDIRVFTAYGDNQDMGYVLYCANYAYPQMYELTYVFVKEEYRNHKVATELIEQSTQIVMAGSLNKVMAVIIDDIAFLKKTLNKLGYKEYLNNELMVYKLKDMLGSTLYSRIDEIKAVTDNAKKLSEAKAISTNQVEMFGRELEKEGLKVDFDELEEDFTRYFFEKGQIVGYMAFSQLEDNILYMNHLHISKNATNKFIIPGMILSALKSCETKMPEDTSILIQFKDKQNVDAIEKAFGIADEYEENHYWVKFS